MHPSAGRWAFYSPLIKDPVTGQLFVIPALRRPGQADCHRFEQPELQTEALGWGRAYHHGSGSKGAGCPAQGAEVSLQDPLVEGESRLWQAVI